MGRMGYQANLYLNTGSPSVPVWSEIDVAGDVTIDDSSDTVDTTVRSTDGVKTSARSLLSTSITFALEADETPGTVLAALLTAARSRSDNVDVFASSTDAEAGATGTRMLSLVKLTDSQPMGDRWKYEFELTPARASTAQVDADVLSLEKNYEIPD